MRTTILSWALVLLAGAGLVSVPSADMYDHPEIFFGLVDIFS